MRSLLRRLPILPRTLPWLHNSHMSSGGVHPGQIL